MARAALTTDPSLDPPELPPMRDDPLLTMADMALDPLMEGMDHGQMQMGDEGHGGHGAMLKDEDLPPGAHRMPDGAITAALRTIRSTPMAAA